VFRCTNLGGIWQWRLGTGCDDGNPCSYGDACNGSDVCTGAAITCADEACIDRECNGTSSCTVTYPSGSTCDDGNLCTYSTTCNGAGSCTGGTTLNCNSLDTTCADYSCDGDSTCAVYYPNGTSCTDSNLCTYNTTCNGAGTCAGGTTLNCDALDTTCINYSCDGDSTCAYVINVGASCDDGNPGTTGDVCLSSGVCQGTSTCTLSVSEQFNTSALPAGWSVEDYDADAYGYDWTWSNASNTTGGSGGYWWVNSDIIDSGNFDDRLITALYNRGTCSTVNISYNHHYAWYSGDYGYVDISVNSGAWTTIASYAATTSGLVTINITPYLSPSCNFRLRFRYVANYDFYWKVDNFAVNGS
jgi:hypothetical protein